MNELHDRERLRLPQQLAGIDLNLVVVFDALVREGSVTRAASSVGVTQSAMSHALRRLRELLGDPVFVRTGNSIALTPRAAALVAPLRSGLSTLARALLTPLTFEPASARRSFRLATPDLFDVLMMPPVLTRIGKEATGIELTLSPLGAELSEQLATGELDLAILPRFDRGKQGAPDPERAGLLRKTLFRDRFVCLVRKGHPALTEASCAAGRLSLERYLALSHALVAPRGDPLGPVDEALDKRRLKRRIGLSVPHFTSALAIVAQSDLVLTAPSAAALVLRDSVVALAPPLALPEHSVNMVWHERLSNDAGHAWLRALLTEAAPVVQQQLDTLSGGTGQGKRAGGKARPAKGRRSRAP